jgi:endonuclease/exonuclease/phosphatase (EEP) superfamily protein YafD
VILAVAIVLAAALTVPLLSRASPGRSAAASAFAAASPVAAVVAVAVTVVLAALTGWPAVITAIPAVLLVGVQLPRRRRPAAAAGPAAALPQPYDPATSAGGGNDGSGTLRVLTLNALVGRASPGRIVAEVERLSPDVFAVQELTPDLATRLAAAGLGNCLPYSCLEAATGSRGIGVWSRWPLTELAPVRDTRRPMPRVALDPGQPVTITLVHPHAPVTDRQQYWLADMDLLLASFGGVTGHHLVIGDFNATRDLRPFRALLGAGFADCADIATRRPWPGFTFPANTWIPPFMRIDHILVSPASTPVPETRLVRVPGTDHLGVFAILELHPVPSASRPTPAEPAVSGPAEPEPEPAAD